MIPLQSRKKLEQLVRWGHFAAFSNFFTRFCFRCPREARGLESDTINLVISIAQLSTTAHRLCSAHWHRIPRFPQRPEKPTLSHLRKTQRKRPLWIASFPMHRGSSIIAHASISRTYAVKHSFAHKTSQRPHHRTTRTHEATPPSQIQHLVSRGFSCPSRARVVRLGR